MTATLVTRRYGDFRGVDFRGEECALSRSPDSKNMWKDYAQLGCIRTRPALALHTEFPAAVHGIWAFGGDKLIHSGKNLYCLTPGGKKTILFSGLREGKSQGFFYDGLFYLLDGTQYICYDGLEVRAVAGYVPTTTIGRSPAGGGTTYEDVNLLTGLRRNSFLADGKSTEFYLDATELDEDVAPTVTVNGAQVTAFTVDYSAGCICFSEAPEAPLTAGQDNVVVTFSKTIPGNRERIENCTLVQIFDNRVFFSGNADHPNLLWHCSLHDPAYVSDLDYYQEGLDDAPIRGMAAGNNALWVFRAPGASGTNVFYHVPTLDDTYGKIYPASHSSITLGCVGGAVNFLDDLVFFSPRGMEGISGDITTEQAVAHRSSLVDRKLTAEADYAKAHLTQWEGYLLLCVGAHVYLADSRGVFTNENHREYEWFYWELEQEVTCAQTIDGVLFFGTGAGLCTLDGDGPVESRWVTPKDRFGHPNRQKSTNKRGFLAELTGDVDVFSRTGNGDFAPAGEFRGVTDYCVPRLRQKKCKDLQLKFESASRFSLETVTLECFVGGYVKG